MLSSMAVRIRQARSLAVMTQGELARAVGVNRSAVAQWERERGGTHPSVAHLAAIALATKVTFEWLATGRGQPRCAAEIEVPAVAPAYTIDALEARCLDAVRRLPRQQRVLISTFLAMLVS
jgi:transcriptional regulator with XRE-family HTH domain